MAYKTSRLLGAFLAATLATTSLTPALAQPARRGAALAPASSPEQVGFDSQRLKKLDAAMAQAVANGEVGGVTTYLARHGKVVAFNTYGEKAPGQPMTKDAIFRIYSMTKPITGVAMMILFEEGKWRLDDPVTKFIPEFKDLQVVTKVDEKGVPTLVKAKRPPTMRELMSHTAGFGYGLSNDHYVDKQFREKRVLSSNSLKEMVDRTATIPLMFQPGELWSYSVAVDLQGYIVEKISGQTLGQFFEDRIFRPLKMHDTAFFAPTDKAARLAAVYAFDRDAGKLIPADERTQLGGGSLQDFTKPPSLESGGGGLVSTTTDYARFAQMIANGGELDGARILSPASVELMGTNAIPENVLVSSDGRSASRFNEAVGFGLDFMVVNDPRKAGTLEGKGTMSWGGAAGTWFWVDPTNDLIFVGMIQRFGGKPGWTNLGETSRTLVYQALTQPAK